MATSILAKSKSLFSGILKNLPRIERFTAQRTLKYVAPMEIPPFVPENDTDDQERLRMPNDFQMVFPDFLPDPTPEWRNRVRERLERKDMINRRSVMEIPEFYVGSIMSVTVADSNSAGKFNRFLGICIQRGGAGLRSWFILRNVVDHQGVEILYEMYSPLIQTIDVLRLEKRLDDELLYLRDAPPEYSTFPFDMEQELLPENAPVPVNPIKVQLKARPWHERWERKDLKGVMDLGVSEKLYKRAKLFEKPWMKYDLMLEYRKNISEEEQADIFKEISSNYRQLEKSRRRVKRQYGAYKIIHHQ